jgi:hypothetical protein
MSNTLNSCKHAGPFAAYRITPGLSAINIGKELHYNRTNGTPMTLQLHFNSFDLMAGTPIWKLYFEPKFSWVSNNFPGNAKKNATVLTMRLFYRFEISGKK